MSNNLNREISQVFHLDEPKLERFSKIFSDEFNSLNREYSAKYSFSTKNGKHFTNGSMDVLLENDNSLDNPIVNIEIEFSTNEEVTEYRGKIQFDRNSDKVKIDVDSSDSKFVSRFFDAIDEQVSRLKFEDTVHKVKDKTLFLFVLVVFMVIPCVITYFVTTTEFGFTEHLSKDDIATLLLIFENAESNEAKVNALFSFYHQLLINNSSPLTFESTFNTVKDMFKNVNFYILSVSILFIIISIRSTLNTALGSIFLWGDQIEYVKRIQDKRKFWVGILVGSFLSGIVVNAITYVVT